VAAAARELYAGLDLLDRQLVDRNDRLCGKVDDLELEREEGSSQLYVSAILSGPGALAYRLGRHRLGRWLQRVNAFVFPHPEGDPARIPFSRVVDIGDHVTLAADGGELATASGERWARDHVISHIPGSGTDADQ
jgi:sporulation protein YlmC with PRC-barrel domain